MNKPKYILLVSQYYYSYHTFIIDTENLNEENYRIKAINLIRELFKYKREENSQRGEYLGDFEEGYYKGFKRRRYNFNDVGDIYFISCYGLNDLMYEIGEFKERSSTNKRGRKDSKVSKYIEDHHDYNKILKMVEKNFEIAK